MRIVVTAFMSLDGVVQAPGGPEEDRDGGFEHGGWSMPYFDPEMMGPVVSNGMLKVDALLFGRRTYEAMAASWPEQEGDPYADRMNSVKKYVASRTMTEADLSWSNSTLLSADDAIGDIARLREEPGGDVMMWGSPALVAQLLSAGLIDEMVLMIEPIVLGGGKSIFPTDGVARPMRLASSMIAATGVMICTFRPSE